MGEEESEGEGVNWNAHLLGTVLESLGEGGVGGRAGLGAGAALDSILGEVAVEDAHVAFSFVAVVRHGHSEIVTVGRPLRLDGQVGWHGGDGNCDSRVWKVKYQ